ncbi:hypothetical protein [Nostoc sp. FACHB-892]|uniref:hypothetical protein n=1 Tax=Nostoc sp. FACHB-892 TaxID=2692843 RepID=UPI0018EFDB04|nr:hypothetical protein [Nostoc sp. FACHB-892]
MPSLAALICQIIHDELEKVIASYVEKQDINLLIMVIYGQLAVLQPKCHPAATSLSCYSSRFLSNIHKKVIVNT